MATNTDTTQPLSPADYLPVDKVLNFTLDDGYVTGHGADIRVVVTIYPDLYRQLQEDSPTTRASACAAWWGTLPADVVHEVSRFPQADNSPVEPRAGAVLARLLEGVEQVIADTPDAAWTEPDEDSTLHLTAARVARTLTAKREQPLNIRSEADHRYNSVFEQLFERRWHDTTELQALLSELDEMVGRRLVEAEQLVKETTPDYDLGDLGHRITAIESMIDAIARAVSSDLVAEAEDRMYFMCKQVGCKYIGPNHHEMVKHRLSHRRAEGQTW